MTAIDVRHAPTMPSLFSVEVRTQPRQPRFAAGVPVALLDDDGLRLWTPILGPATVLMGRLFLAEPGRAWHIGDVAGQLGIGTDYAHKVVRRLAQFGWLRAVEANGAVTYHVTAARALTADQVDMLHPDLAARYARLSGLVGQRP